MIPKIHHPRVLLPLLLVIGGVAAAAVSLADAGTSNAIVFQANGEQPVVAACQGGGDARWYVGYFEDGRTINGLTVIEAIPGTTNAFDKNHGL